MNIIKPRFTYLPREYPKARDYWLLQQQGHWLHTLVPMGSDINDWKYKFTDTEKHLVGSILKGFTQMEVVVGDVWTTQISKWFPKPEIVAIAITFGAFETIHQEAYNLLDESLGLVDFKAFLEHEETKNKLDFLLEQKSKEDTIESIALRLGIFSALTEGVNLFSSFAILLSFQTRDLLKGVGQIVSLSIKDENLHSEAGCWLFNEMCKEASFDLRKTIEDDMIYAFRLGVDLEHKFIDEAFTSFIKCYDPLKKEEFNLTKDHLKNFVCNRANLKLNEIGYKSIYEIDDYYLSQMSWFDFLSKGKEHADFFATKVTDYSKGTTNDWDDI